MRHLLSATLLLTACEGALLGGAVTPEAPAEPAPVAPMAMPTGGGVAAPLEPTFPTFAPGVLRPRVMLGQWYRNTVRDVLGDAAMNAVSVTPDLTEGGLVTIGASSKSVTPTDVTRFEDNGFLAAQAVLGDATGRARVIPCTPANATDSACMQQVVTTLGRRLFRRPLSTDEVTRWRGIGLSAAQGYSSFTRGVEFVIAGFLQSPNFIYLDERGAADAATGWQKLDPYELASRLSFFLVQSTPDDALLDAAATGGLSTVEGVRAQAERLLRRTEARDAVSSLFDEVFELEGLMSAQKSDPAFTREVATSMRQELRYLFAHVALDPGNDFRDLLTTRMGFVDRRIAPLYGVPGPMSGFQPVELPEARAGVLTRLGYLANKAHDADTSPTHRGKLVRQRLLCMAVAMAPPDVVAVVPPPDQMNRRTFRQRLEERTAEPRCQGCHQLMDPFGFPFEGFDSLGRPRTLDNGLPIDSTGAFDPIFSRHERYTGAKDFAALLHDDPRFTECMTTTVFRQATGRFEAESEGRALYELHRAWKQTGYRYADLVVAVVTSDAFRFGTVE
ncbi:MAG: DUF1592 domain-containing protein [Myxococcus sp.]|nr:DUF1592 domain-containing protein [Myxococcus sp.]